MSTFYDGTDRGPFKLGKEEGKRVKCLLCEDYGWVFQKRDDGRSGAARCECKQNRDRTSEYMAKANIPPTYAQVDFDTFNTPADNPTAKNLLTLALNDVKKWAERYPATPKPGIK